MWSSTVILILNQEVRWNQTTFKVVTDRHGKDGKDILICWMHTNNITNPNQKWTKVRVAPVPYGGTYSSLAFTTALQASTNISVWNLRHEQPICRALQTFSVLIWTEQLDASIFCTVSFQPFKGLLTVMQTWKIQTNAKSHLLSIPLFPSSIAKMCQIAIR